MSALLQLISLFFNLIYGFIIYYVAIFNYWFIRNETRFLKLLITCVFMFDFTFIYLVLIYKINSGYFHIYYLLMFSIGFILAIYVKKHVNLTKFLKKLFDKLSLR